MKYANWILARLEEPSTWSGTGVVAAMLLIGHVPTNLASAILTAGAALAALLSIVLPEKAGK